MRPDLSRLMQLQAAGAGLPTSIPGLPPGLMGGSAAAIAAAAAAAGHHGHPGLGHHHGLGPHGLPVSSAASLLSGLPPTSAAAVAAAAQAHMHERRREEEMAAAKAAALGKLELNDINSRTR